MKPIPTSIKSTTIVLGPSLRAEIERAARDAYPREACGLLIGKQHGARIDVDRVRAARNLDDARPNDRYELDPADHLAAEEEAHALGLDVVGVWHSHPDHPARPSETDRVRAWNGWSYAIVSVEKDGARELRSWRLVEDRFLEEEVLP